MEQAQKLSITLPFGLAKLVRAKVKAGAFASNSEVIRVALRVWQEHESERARDIATIRMLLDDALNDPRPRRTPEQVAERINRLHAETAKVRRRGR